MIWWLSAALASPPPEPPLAGDVLGRDALVAAVLAANPEAEMAEAALLAARARRDAAGRLPPPMVEVGVMPVAIAAGMAGVSLGVSQPLPLWGMRSIERDMAAAGVDAAAGQRDAMRVELARMATMSWVDWYVIHQQIDRVEATAHHLDEHAEATLARLATGRALTGDALRAQADAAGLRADLISLRAERDVVADQINTLLQRPLGADVPPPPAKLPPPSAPPPAGGVDRGEVDEARAMRDMAARGVDMAISGRRPMIGVMTSVDTMESVYDAWMLGVEFELPVGGGDARVGAARADLAVADAMVARVESAVTAEVSIARRREEAARGVVIALDTQLLPVARSRVEAARAAFAAGQDDVRPLIDAEIALLDAEVRHQQALATWVAAAAEVSYAAGHIPEGATP